MKKKLVRGIGLYESGVYPAYVDSIVTKEYSVWSSMLDRCQIGGDYQKRYPAYIGCEVHPDFIKFQDFAAWCQDQIGFGSKGFALDKDILVRGNKIYGPDTCVFVPTALNNLINHNRVNKGEFPTGICLDRKSLQFRVQVSTETGYIHVGRYDTIDDAVAAYKISKLDEIQKRAKLYQNTIDPKAFDALINFDLNV